MRPNRMERQRSLNRREHIERVRSLRMGLASLQLAVLFGLAAMVAILGLGEGSGRGQLSLWIAGAVALLALLSWRWQRQRFQRQYELALGALPHHPREP